MRCCVCLFQQSLQCSPSKMAAGESNSRSSCLNLSNSGPLGNAPPSNSAHSSPASNGGSMGAVGGINRSAGNSNPQSGPENGGGAETAVRSTPSAQNPSRQSVGQSGATSGAASNMTATSSSSSSSASTASADASAAVPSLPSSPASVLVYREPVYNWQATKSTVKERFAFLFNNEVLSDVHFLVGKGMGVQRIPAHRFLYSDEVQIGPETVMTTLYTAKKYAVPALEAHCVEFLKKNLRADNAFMLLTQARLFDEPQLASLCLENIDKNTADALAAEGFTDIDLDTLVAVLERDTLGVREVRLFGAAVRWADAEAQRQQLQPTPENKRRVLGKALSLIRFPLMTIEEFAAGPAQSGILTDREVVSLFLHFTVNPKPHVEFIDRPRCCLRGKECSITRFSQVESRWGYSGTSDRIRFSVNRRIFVVGFGLYGSIHGPTDYQVNIQIIHTDSNTVLGQNDTGFSCDGTASTFRVMFKEPVEILPSVNYIACATLKGPDSHYGTKGMRKVTHEAPATGTKTCFTFCYAAGNNNGTSVEDGQIPEVIFYT
ncbi:BTB/POZ domain-containing protein 2a isoform X3 [Megalobrama amblycephala]|uniref:BTB/POZ domain-containing protein 2a isoform X3 n=1 Tax=Megalobrama amblycephala TaxID=75352 RepID=UPI002014023D|nr:BTB/POZ domain-containing protein 2a isoform X3 [Megalobrama amblycephala]XP_051764576.1 BTB/POZ domain-containing protein 2a isoform X3 [Ctenopharyngodon idella]